MPVPQRLGLLDKLNGKRPVLLAHLRLDALAEVAHDDHDLVDTDGDEFIDDVRQDGLAGDVQECLRLGVSVGPQPGADAGCRDDRLHRVSVLHSLFQGTSLQASRFGTRVSVDRGTVQ